MDDNKETEEYDAEYLERKKRHVNDKSKLAWALVGVVIMAVFMILALIFPYLLISYYF